MQVDSLKIPNVILITLKKFEDSRGFFTERFRPDLFEKAGLPSHFVQDNFSKSAPKVLRGVHYQFELPQGKLITCLSGRIFDVVTDVRHQSASFGQSVTVELDGAHPQWVWIPPGFAHGFCVLGNNSADILYKVTKPYNPSGENGIMWNDPDLKIPWPIENPLLSPKDEKLLSFSSYKREPKF